MKWIRASLKEQLAVYLSIIISSLIGNPNDMQNKWKMGTPRTLVKRAYNICATNEYLKNQLNHIRKVSDA